MSNSSPPVYSSRVLRSASPPYGIDADETQINEAYEGALEDYNSTPKLDSEKLIPPFPVNYQYSDHYKDTPRPLTPGSDAVYYAAVTFIDHVFTHLLGSDETRHTISSSFQLCIWRNRDATRIWKRNHTGRAKTLQSSDFFDFMTRGPLAVVFTDKLSSDSWGETTNSTAIHLSAALACAYGKLKDMSTGSPQDNKLKKRFQIMEYTLFASFLHEYAGHAFVKFLFGDHFQSPDPLGGQGLGEMGYVVEHGLMGIVPVLEWDQGTVQRLVNEGNDPAAITIQWLLNVDQLVVRRAYAERVCYPVDMRQIALALASLNKKTIRQVPLSGFGSPKARASNKRARLSHQNWEMANFDDECEEDAQEEEESALGNNNVWWDRSHRA